MPSRTVVALDLDGTLTRGDTLLPFLRRACGRSPTAAALLAQSLLIVRSLTGNASRHDAKERLLARLLRGRSLADLEEAADAFADSVMATGMRAEILERVERHRGEGHELVIVTASPELYVTPLGRRLGVDAVLGTRLEVDEAGYLTGRLEGLNCRGPEKVARLQAWLGEDATVAWAYGDSRGDRELLALAHHGVRVGRRGGLPPLADDSVLP
jgi:phosphatidylglycerophosphatase C